MSWFWYFLFYSFLGFLLEVFFAHFAGVDPHRKCFRILPLCPVYGFGACSIVGAVGDITSPLAIFLLGGGLATAWEYLTAAFYEEVLGTSFWNYSDMPWNLHGRVCLPFSIAWGLLSIPLVLWLHPRLAALSLALPVPATALMVLALGADGLLTCLLLARSGTRDSLNWGTKK